MSEQNLRRAKGRQSVGLDEEASRGSELRRLEHQTLNAGSTSSRSPTTHAPGLPAVMK